MLSERQYTEICQALNAGQFEAAIAMACAASNGKGSKSGAWGVLDDFHRLCEEAEVNIPSAQSWAGRYDWPDTGLWEQNATAFFSKKEKVYLFYWEKGKEMPEVDALYFRMWKDDFGFAVVASNSEIEVKNFNFSQNQHLLGGPGEIVEL